MNELELNWTKTLNLFHNDFTDNVVYNSLIAPLKAKEIRNQDLIVISETVFQIGYIEEHIPKLEEIFNSITHGSYHLIVLSEVDYNDKYLDDTQDILNFDDHLNPDFTFENFVVGTSNRIAQNASLAVAMKPGVAYSPLFMYSNSGLGKTHLLNAIGNYVKKNNPNSKILYCSSEEFVNEYISSLTNHKMDEFNYKFRHIDVLLIDDIQFIASKDSSSEMFFNIFNNLKNNNKQIVITSDKPPKDLKGMENRLVSRFTNGLTVSIDTPEFETAKAILSKKIEIEGVDYPIDDEVIDFISIHFNRDVRELEGTLKRLLFYKLVFGKELDHINLDFALEAFGDNYIQEEKNDDLTVDYIKKKVAEYYNLTIAQLNSKSRTSNLIVARHIAMYLVRTLISDISYIQIGAEFGGRDHSTVMKACDKVKKNIKKDANYRKAVEDIKNKIC